MKSRFSSIEKSRGVGAPTAAFIGVSWLCLATGVIAYLVGLWNAEMALNEKGFYFAVFLFGLYSAIYIQKNVRDREEGIPVTDLYYGISYFCLLASITLLVVGLYHADLFLSEKGFFGMCYVLSLFAVITVQKNVRDMK